MTQIKSRLTKGISVLLAALMAVSMLPGGLLKASAASVLNITQTGGAGGYTQDADGNITITGAGNYTIDGSGSTTTDKVTVTGCTANITLKNTNIEPGSGCAFKIVSGAAVNLTLSGANTLKSKSGYAGLNVPSGASVSIAGSGSLIASGGDSGDGNAGGAGIGKGSGDGNGGSIDISSGTVTANGFYLGAGINGTLIAVSGGIVMANGGELGYGIRGGTVNISGGTVMGHDIYSSNNVITITGGSVNPSSILNDVTDGNGRHEYCVATSTSFSANQTVTGSVCGGLTSNMQTDASGKLYFWMPYSGSAVVEHDSTYYSANVSKNSGGNIVTLSVMTELNILTGNITIADNSITQANNAAVYNTNDCVITQSGSGSTSNTISVTGGSHSIVLRGVNRDSSAGCALDILSGAAVYLSLDGASTLKSDRNYAGIRVQGGAALTITAQNGGSLDVTGGTYSAGIGSGDRNGDNCGSITINGGNITATGGESETPNAGGAGIGGGNGKSGGSITINRGTVKATGRNYAAGIGGGAGGAGGTITINGGNVTAYGAVNGAGIGGGDNGNGGAITMSGGTVMATGGSSGAGIGGGFCGKGANLTITGGTVNAKTTNTNSIGGGGQGSAGTTVITGGSVKAGFVQGTPTNGASTPANVYRTVVVVPKGKNVESLTVTQGGSPYAYGTKDMQIDASYGELFLWLPANAAGEGTTADVVSDSGAYSGYHGTVSSEVNQNALKIDQNLIISGAADHTYGQAYTVTVSGGASGIASTVAYSGTDSVTGTAYSSTTQPADPGTYTVTALAAGNDTYNPGTASASFTITQKPLTDSSVTVADLLTQEYDGSAHTPAVSVKDGNTDLIKDTDYTVTDKTTSTIDPAYLAVGSFTLKITGKGCYTGTVEKTYIIEAAPTIDVECASGSSLSNWSSSVALSIGYAVGSSGLKSVTVSKDGNSAQNITDSFLSGYTLTHNGTYAFTVTSNSGFTAFQTVTAGKIDNGAPSLTSISGNPVSPVQSAILSVTATPGASGIGNVKASRKSDSGQWTQIQGAQINDKTNTGGSHTYTYTAAQNGMYRFTVTSTAGLSADSVSVDVTQIDTAKPVVQINSDGYSEGNWANQNVTLNVSDGTANLGTTTYEYRTDGTNWVPVAGGSVTDTNEGARTYYFRATSASGLVSDNKVFTVKIDKTAPETHQITIANNNFTSLLNTIAFRLFFKETQTATITAVDNGSGVASVKYQIVHTQNDYSENSTWADYPNGGISLNPDNKYIVYAKITDNAGNHVIVNSDGVVVDQTSPGLTIAAHPEWQTGTTESVVITASDALAGLQSVSYTTDEPTPQSGTVNLVNTMGTIYLGDQGQYNLTVTATDKAGNTVTRTSYIQWDKALPTITVNGNPASPAQCATLDITATAGVSGVKSVTVSGPQGNNNITGTYHSGYAITQNGTYTFTVTNNAGVSVNSSPVVVTNIDAAKPVVQINSNGYTGDTWTMQNVKLDISNTAANLGTTTYEYRTDGTNWAPVAGGSVTDTDEGARTYSFRATSASGVLGDIKSITVKIDKTAPTNMAITFAQNPFKTVAHFVTFGFFFGNTVNVNFSANDTNGSGVDHYEYQTVAEGGTFNPSGTWQTGSLSIAPDFKGAIYARAIDKASNISGTVIKSLVVDKTAPVITANSGNSTLNTMDTNASIPIEIKDSGAGVGTVVYQINGGAAKTVDLTADNYTDQTDDYTFSIGSLPDGAYDVTVNATDNSGNPEATTTVHVVKNAAQTGFGFDCAKLDKAYGDTPFTVAATGGQGGGAVTYAVTSGTNVLSVNAATGKVSVQKAGTAVITATKAEGNGYQQATAELAVNVSKAAPTVQTLPTASGIQVIGKLSSSQLTGGKSSVPGTFAWTNPDTVVSSSGSYSVTFTPTDADDYAPVSCNVQITVTPLLSGSNSNAQLDFTGVTLPAGVTSVSLGSAIQSQTGGGSAYSVVEKLIGGNKTLGNLASLTIYDLKLLDQNGNPVESFTGKIKVKIPIPSGMSGNLKVLWYNPADGTLTDMNATQENGFLVFETSHFSYYAIAGLSAASTPVVNPKTGSENWPIVPLSLLGGGALSGVIIRKKFRYRVKKSSSQA